MQKSEPELTFVAAHPGDMQQFMNHLEILKRYKNAYLDLSGTGIFRYGLVAYGIKQVGAERFLFGTDYPICNPRMYVQAIVQEPISQKAQEMVFGGNAERILYQAGRLCGFNE